MNNKIPIKDTEYEVYIKRKTTKELIAFDFGLIFMKGSDQIQVYVDEELRTLLNKLLEEHDYVLVKTNYQSPDVTVYTE